jgi:exopolysaccharide biosynthesis polyprenyl glycosylphosphotransferase
MRKANFEFNKKWIYTFFGIIDVCATIFTLFLASWISQKVFNESIKYDQEYIIISLCVVLIWIILLKATHLARIPRTSPVPLILMDFFRLSCIGGFILLLFDWAIRFDNFPAITLAIFIVLNFFTLSVLRLVTFKIFKKFRTIGHNKRNLVIVANSKTDTLIDKIINQKEWGYQILHIITDSQKIKLKYQDLIKIYPKKANIKSLIRFDIIDELICCDCGTDEKKFLELVDFCHSIGVTVRTQNQNIFQRDYNSHVQYFDRIPLLSYESNPMHKFEHVVKSVVEIAVSFIILFLLSPILLVIALLIWITSKGPVIFKQERVGLKGRKFYIYKFRTMVSNAEELKQKLMELNESDGPTFKIKKDPRITGIGRILRKTNLDEIPQLFNVIKGEMSIIGPRPPLQSEVEKYEEWQLKRLSVKPGLTCTWQIVPNRNDIKFEKWVRMDIQYIENWTLMSDISLFFKTFKTVLFARGT